MKRRKKDREVWDALIMVFQFGINMIVPIVLCLFLGLWISNQTGAKWITVILFFIGALAGATNIYKIVRKMIRNTQKDNKDLTIAEKNTDDNIDQ